MSADSSPVHAEPWLRGPIADVHPLLMPTLHSFAQVREDLARWTRGVTDAQIWLRPHGLAPVGFHLRHIAGSIDRLTTYLEGRQLTAEQLDAAGREMDPGTPRSTLLDEVAQMLDRSERVIRSLNAGILHEPEILHEPRYVGRKRLSTTVIGLVVHLAEHTQRHVGELIVTAKVVTAV
jgi:hypothetical protein